MFITSDAGNSWRQVKAVYSQCILNRRFQTFFFNQTSPHDFFSVQIFDEEYNVWFLDNGGALLAVLHAATPIRHVWWVQFVIKREHAGDRNCRSCSGKLPGFNFVLGVGNARWCWIWLHLMFWNVDGPSLCDYCIGSTTSELSFPTGLSVLQLCTLSWIWRFECFYGNEKSSRMEILDTECPHKSPYIVGAL